MKKTIKFLENGEYVYVTVKDVGDIDQLKTAVKTDLVSAINELMAAGFTDEDKAAMQVSIDSAVNASAGSINQQIAEIVANSEKMQQQAIINLDEAKSHAIEIAKQVSAELQAKLDAANADIDAARKEANDNYIDVNAKLKSTDQQLATTKDDLQKTRDDLNGIDDTMVTVDQSIDDIKGELSRKVSSQDYNLLNSTVERHETAIKQTTDALRSTVSKEELSLIDQAVKKTQSEVEQTAEGLKTKVSSDELDDQVIALTDGQNNLIVHSRDLTSGESSNTAFVNIMGTEFEQAQIVHFSRAGDTFTFHIDNLTIGKQYVFSVYSKIDKDTADLFLKNNMNADRFANAHGDFEIKSEWSRYFVTFEPSAESIDLKVYGEGNFAGNTLYASKPKLEIGSKPSKWSENPEDFEEKIRHVESAQEQTDDRITAAIESQTKLGDTLSTTTTSLNQLADKFDLQVEEITRQGEDIKSTKAQIEQTAKSITTSVEENFNNAVSQMQDSSTNLVQNSNFSRDFEKWQSVNSSAKLVELNGNKWVHMSQTGLTSDFIMSITSNKFPTKKNDTLSISFEYMTADFNKVDNKTLLRISLLDINGTRVDYKDVTAEQMGLTSVAANTVKRLQYRLKIDREDVKFATVAPSLYRNGDVYYSKLYARISSFIDADWQPAPEDAEVQQLELKTEIEQTADSIKETVSSIKEIKNGISGMDDTIKANKTEVEKTIDGVKTSVSEVQKNVDSVGKSLSDYKNVVSETYSTIEQTAGLIAAKVTASDVTGMLNGYATQSWSQGQISAAKNEISASVETVQTQINNSAVGTNLYTDTRNFDSLASWWGSSFWTKTTDTYNGLAVVQTTQSWNGLSQYIQVKKGDVLTYSVYAKYISGTGTSTIYWGLNSQIEGSYSNARANPGALAVTITDSWQRISATAVATSDGYLRPRLERETRNTNTLQIAGIKVEKGSKATDWCLAPEDQATIDWTKSQLDITDKKITAGITTVTNTLNNNIANATANMATTTWTNTQIDAAKKAINLSVEQSITTSENTLNNNIDNATKDMATQTWTKGQLSITDGNISASVQKLHDAVTGEISTATTGMATQTWTQGKLKLTASSLTSQISSVQVGGRNYIKNSDQTITINGDTDHYKSMYTNLTDEYWTYSAEVKYVRGSDTSVHLAIYSADTEMGYNSVSVPIVNGKISWTFKPNNPAGVQLLMYASSGDWATTTGKTLEVSNQKLEKGNKATDWSPAPEDQATVTQFTEMQQTLKGVRATANSAVTQGQLTLLSDQFTSTITDANNAQKSYLFNTAQSFVTTKGPSQGPIAQTDLATMQKLRGKQVTISADIEGQNCQFIDGQRHLIVFEIEFQFTDGTYQYLDVQHDFTKGESWKGRAARTYTIQDKEIKVVSSTPIGYVLDGFDYGYVGYPMLVLGSQSANWSPAAFDHSSQITQLQNDINLRVKTGDLVSQIDVNAKRILLDGASTYITNTTHIDTGVIKTAMIDDAAITNAKIVNLDGSKIVAHSITADQLDVNAIQVGLNTYGAGWQITPASIAFLPVGTTHTTISLSGDMGITYGDFTTGEMLGHTYGTPYSINAGKDWFNGISTELKYNGADFWAVLTEEKDSTARPRLTYSRNRIAEFGVFQGWTFDDNTHFGTIGPMDPDDNAQMRVVRVQVAGRWSTGFMNRGLNGAAQSGILFTDDGACYLGRANRWYNLFDIANKLGLGV